MSCTVLHATLYTPYVRSANRITQSTTQENHSSSCLGSIPALDRLRTKEGPFPMPSLLWFVILFLGTVWVLGLGLGLGLKSWRELELSGWMRPTEWRRDAVDDAWLLLDCTWLFWWFVIILSERGERFLRLALRKGRGRILLIWLVVCNLDGWWWILGGGSIHGWIQWICRSLWDFQGWFY